MTLLTESRIPFGTKESNGENKDPFVVSSPRKQNPIKDTSTSATPNSKSTPLHKRFLEEVTMSPGAPSTPPRTPSKSPRRGQMAGQMLEVGQNGFYFSVEIPEKKITPKRAATPDYKALGRQSPSPLNREMKSEVRTGGRVKDILRKNLFGTPMRKSRKTGADEKENDGTDKPRREVRMSPSRAEGFQCHTRGAGKSNIVQSGTSTYAATKNIMAPSFENASVTAQSSAAPLSTTSPLTGQIPDTSTKRQETPQRLPPVPTLATDTPAMLVRDQKRVSANSTPSDIGHLMAGLSNRSSKVQTLPETNGLESMPTPLRKMSEKLRLSTQHVVYRTEVHADGESTSKDEKLEWPVSPLFLRDTTSKEYVTASSISTGVRTTALERPSTVTSPVESSRPSTATSSSFGLPSTPSRPGAPNRSKSYGTPACLRSSIQKDMYRMQESLRRSVSQDSNLTNGTRPATPISPTVAAKAPSTLTTGSSLRSVRTAARPVSMVGPPSSTETISTQTVPRRLLNTAARKPRPKSMIVGSAKILETVAAQIDSPRERAKLRSATGTAPNARNGPATPRPVTATSTSRSPKATQKLEKPQPTVRTTKSAALRAAAHAQQRVAPATHTTVPPPQKQRVVSAEAIAEQVSAWNKDDGQTSAPKIPIRTKSLKKPGQAGPKPRPTRNAKTPEPKDSRADSGIAQSYTPPGNPTRLPSPAKSPSKTRLVAGPPRTPATAPKLKIRAATGVAQKPSHAAQLRTPFPRDKLHVDNEALDALLWTEGRCESDPNALRTPSKAIQSSLDAAIDKKIEEDKRRAGWF